VWQHHPAINCYHDYGGAEIIVGADPLPGVHTLAECKTECQQRSECEAIVMRSWIVNGPKSPCWLRQIMNLEKCMDYPDFDTWVIPPRISA